MKYTPAQVNLLCAQVSAAIAKKKSRYVPTNNATKAAPVSKLAVYASLNGAAKFSFFRANADELWAQFAKGVKA